MTEIAKVEPTRETIKCLHVIMYIVHNSYRYMQHEPVQLENNKLNI